MLAYAAIHTGDKVGVLFSDRVEKIIPPRKGRSHILRIIRDVLTFKAEGRKTDLAVALDATGRVLKARCWGLSFSSVISGIRFRPQGQEVPATLKAWLDSRGDTTSLEFSFGIDVKQTLVQRTGFGFKRQSQTILVRQHGVFELQEMVA